MVFLVPLLAPAVGPELRDLPASSTPPDRRVFSDEVERLRALKALEEETAKKAT